MKINKFTSIVASLMLAGAFTSISACEVPADVHPLSCPNPVNAKANKKTGVIPGLTPAALLGGAVYQVGENMGEPIDMNDVDLDKPIMLFIDEDGKWLSNGHDEDWDTKYNGNPEYRAEAVRAVIDDVAAPAPEGTVDPALCGLDEDNCYGAEDGNAPDKIDDLAVKFKTQDVIKAIEDFYGVEVVDGDLYCVTILAKTKSGLNVHGTDTIRINK